MNELTMTLLDIATTTLHGLNNSRGPNLWNEVKDDSSAYGKNYDFEILRHGSNTVINPVCNAALQWLYFHLPQDCPRWGANGFKLDASEAGPVIERMLEDGLISEDEYVFNMNAEQRDQHAGENQ